MTGEKEAFVSGETQRARRAPGARAGARVWSWLELRPHLPVAHHPGVSVTFYGDAERMRALGAALVDAADAAERPAAAGVGRGQPKRPDKKDPETPRWRRDEARGEDGA